MELNPHPSAELRTIPTGFLPEYLESSDEVDEIESDSISSNKSVADLNLGTQADDIVVASFPPSHTLHIMAQLALKVSNPLQISRESKQSYAKWC